MLAIIEFFWVLTIEVLHKSYFRFTFCLVKALVLIVESIRWVILALGTSHECNIVYSGKKSLKIFISLHRIQSLNGLASRFEKLNWCPKTNLTLDVSMLGFSECKLHHFYVLILFYLV